jgi:hypothetical protein
MTEFELRSELLKQLDQLPLTRQGEVLQFARSLTEPPVRGVSGDKLLRFAGTMTNEEAEEFLKSIDEDCERIEPNEW